CISIKKQLSMDYGARSGEGWYSKIDRKVLIEKRIGLKNKELLDYKFHVFSQGAGKEPIVIVHVDFARQSAHRRSYFDVDLNLLPFRVLYAQGDMAIEKPTNYELMVDIAKKLAEPFSYVRVDLYNVEGKIFFGEL